jgi:hypothetical protein
VSPEGSDVHVSTKGENKDGTLKRGYWRTSTFEVIAIREMTDKHLQNAAYQVVQRATFEKELKLTRLIELIPTVNKEALVRLLRLELLETQEMSVEEFAGDPLIQLVKELTRRGIAFSPTSHYLFGRKMVVRHGPVSAKRQQQQERPSWMQTEKP